MTFREWNNRKNNWLRAQKGKWVAKLLGRVSAGGYERQQVHKILLLRNDNKLGDALVSSTLLRGLKELFPQAKIEVVAGTSNGALLRANPAVSAVYVATEGLLSLVRCGLRLRREK